MYDPIVSLITYTRHHFDFNPAIKGCTTRSPVIRVLDARAKGVGITSHQRSPCSIKTPGESHAKGGKARTGDQCLLQFRGARLAPA